MSHEKRYTLDGEPIADIGAFIETNAAADPDINEQEIGDLEVGQTMILGGGAGQEFELERVV